MLARVATAKKAASKFEDTHMSRPRIMSDLPHRQAPRVPPRQRTAVAAAVDSASGARHRGLGAAGRGTPPRSPMNEKKPAAAGSACGAGSRVAELEAKLGKAHDQLAEMRDQLLAAEKARKDARAAFVDAKKQRDVDTSEPAQDNDDDDAPADRVTNGSDDGTSSMGSPATGVLEQILPESENKRGQVDEHVEKNSDDGDEVNDNVAIVADGECKRGNLEADELRSKLAAKDREVYEVRAKLMVKDMEVNELKTNMTAWDTAIEELTAKLVATDTEIATLRAHNADLRRIASEAAAAARETSAAKAREAEHALVASAAREDQLAERLAASERAREALEVEARRSRVQSEQWRKAAEEAASVLGGAPGDKDMRRHDSVGSGGRNIDDEDAKSEGSGGKRKSGGGAVRLLADLWKKKSPK